MDSDKRQRIREIAIAELKKGKTPAEITELALAAGIPKQVVHDEFTRLAESGSIAFFGVLKDFGNQKTEVKTAIEKGLSKIWDPAGETITLNTFHGVRQELEGKAKEYLENPSIPRRNLLLLLSPVGVMALGLLFVPGFLQGLLRIDEGNGIFLLILPFVPAAVYIGKVFKLQRDLIKMLIAQKEGWIYSPSERAERWQMLVKKFPELFQKGNASRNFQDEFWGTTEYRGKPVHFWSGIFEYVVESTDSKGRRNRTTYRNNAFALQLRKQLKTDFRLAPEHIGMRILNFFRRKEIDTESAEFNQSFAVFYNGSKVDNQLEIVKTLSPSVQVRLLQMKERFGKFSLQFRDDTVMIVFPGRLLKRMKTNFFRQVAVDERDKEQLKDRLASVLDISSDILRFLD